MPRFALVEFKRVQLPRRRFFQDRPYDRGALKVRPVSAPCTNDHAGLPGDLRQPLVILSADRIVDTLHCRWRLVAPRKQVCHANFSESPSPGEVDTSRDGTIVDL